MTHHFKASTEVVVLNDLYKLQVAEAKEALGHLRCRLEQDNKNQSLQLAEALEDIANGYLDMSYMISERHLAARRVAHASLSETMLVGLS
jgi:hypothetical protein